MDDDTIAEAIAEGTIDSPLALVNLQVLTGCAQRDLCLITVRLSK